METLGRLLTMPANSAALNMAIDEAILIEQKTEPNPTLRFYAWSTPTFSFGYFQDIASEVDVAACRSEGIELVRRMTGGGTVVHGWDLTYTLILPRDAQEIAVSDAYRCLGQALVKVFQTFGVPTQCQAAVPRSAAAALNICLVNPAEHDVMSTNGKLAGVSVRRNQDGIMFQGYISLDMPPASILVHLSKDPLVQRALCEQTTAINTDGHLISRDALIRAISKTADLGIVFRPGQLSPTEYTQAETLAEMKYATTAWNFG